MTASYLVLWAVAMVGIDVGWQPLEDGGLEYIIQIEPEMLESLRDGSEIVSEIPPGIGSVRTYRIRVGKGPLPRRGLEGEAAERASSLGQDEPSRALGTPDAVEEDQEDGVAAMPEWQHRAASGTDAGPPASRWEEATHESPSAADTGENHREPLLPLSESPETTQSPSDVDVADTYGRKTPVKTNGSRSLPDAPDPFSSVPLGPRYSDVTAVEPPTDEGLAPEAERGDRGDETTRGGPAIETADRDLVSTHPPNGSDRVSSAAPTVAVPLDSAGDVASPIVPRMLPQQESVQPMEHVATYRETTRATAGIEESRNGGADTKKEGGSGAVGVEAAQKGQPTREAPPSTAWLALLIVLALSLGVNIYLVLIAASQRRSYRQLAARARTASA